MDIDIDIDQDISSKKQVPAKRLTISASMLVAALEVVLNLSKL